MKDSTIIVCGLFIILVGPFLVIWALNQFFNALLPYRFTTWLTVLALWILVGFITGRLTTRQ